MARFLRTIRQLSCLNFREPSTFSRGRSHGQLKMGLRGHGYAFLFSVFNFPHLLSRSNISLSFPYFLRPDFLSQSYFTFPRNIQSIYIRSFDHVTHV